MDTSPEYINMCRKAKELQAVWEPSRGDWFLLYDEIENIGDYSEDLHPIDYREEFPISKKNCIWLPRIDQLIEIVMNGSHLRDKTAHGITKVQNIYYGDGVFSIMGEHDTIEVAWLKIYMHSKFKSWDGEDWI